MTDGISFKFPDIFPVFCRSRVFEGAIFTEAARFIRKHLQDFFLMDYTKSINNIAFRFERKSSNGTKRIFFKKKKNVISFSFVCFFFFLFFYLLCSLECLYACWDEGTKCSSFSFSVLLRFVPSVSSSCVIGLFLSLFLIYLSPKSRCPTCCSIPVMETALSALGSTDCDHRERKKRGFSSENAMQRKRERKR